MPNGHLYSRLCRLADVPGVQFAYLINVDVVHKPSYCVRMLTQSPCLVGLFFIFCIKEEEPLWKVIVRRVGSIAAFMIYDVLRLASTLGYSGRIRSIVSSHCRDIVGACDVSLVGLVSGSCPHRQD